jgi:DNA-binding response OmpR family regulator/tetratricopeptide (TPR) repeat protein
VSKILKILGDSADVDSMAKKIKILLVEDDKRFGESLQKLLEKSGFDCIYAEKPQTALSYCKLHTFDIAIIDCMLPQMNGVELALKVKEFFGNSIVLFMMSGIYKDRNFTISTIKKTAAISFLIKPFEIESLIEQLNEISVAKSTSNETILSNNPLKNLLLQENITQNIVYSAIEKSSTINGQELPIVFNFLLSFRGVGKLTLKTDTLELPVHFSEGTVSIPTLSCTGSKLRNIIISKECVAQDDLQTLKLEDTTIEKLIEKNFLSPHFGSAIYKEYSLNQLNAFAQNSQVQMTFLPGKVNPQSISLSQTEVDNMIYNWISASEAAWLKAYYLQYNQHAVKKMSTSQNKTQLFPIVSGNKHLVSFMLENKSIDEVLNQTADDVPLRLIHLMMVYREFHIGAKSNSANNASQVERLKKILQAMETQNAFERLGLKETSSDLEIKRSYTDMSQTLHPDKLKEAPQELIIISTKVYDKVQDAYNHIKTPEKRLEYIKLMETQKTDNLKKANRLLDESTNHLMRGDLTTAEALLKETNQLAPFLPRLKLLQTWLHLKTKKMTASDALKNILALPNEEKEAPTYMHVRGLCHLALNEYEKAMNSFKNALSKDSSFVASRRELSLITQDDKKPNVSILNADLRDVVGLFFNKKPKKK